MCMGHNIDRCLKIKRHPNDATIKRMRQYYTPKSKIQQKISLNEKRDDAENKKNMMRVEKEL